METLSQKQIDFKKLAAGEFSDSNNQPIEKAISAIDINTLEPNLRSFVKNIPQALANTFFRPYVWELKSPMMLMAGLENIVILVFVLLCIVFIKPLRAIQWEYVLFCLSFVIIQFIIIGETTPIIGAIARYKSIALPFLLIAGLFLLDKNKLAKRLPIFKKILQQ